MTKLNKYPGCVSAVAKDADCSRAGYIAAKRKDMRENTIFVLFLIVSLFLFSISLAAGQVTIDNVDASSIDENNTLSVSFSASTDTVNDISYRIYLGGVLVSNTSSYERFMNYSSSGSYNFTFVASDI
jgi:hypothetical protein